MKKIFIGIAILAIAVSIINAETTQNSSAKNDKATFEKYKKSADQNNSEGIYNLGVMYLNGTGVKKDMKKAESLWVRSAKMGYARAQYNLGVIYFKGMTGKQDNSKAFEWFEITTKQNLPEGLYMVGLLYEEGKGVEKNIKKALGYYVQAADLGEKRALQRITKEPLLKKDVEFRKKGANSLRRRDFRSAIRYYQESLSIRKKIFGEMHINTTTCYKIIESLYEREESEIGDMIGSLAPSTKNMSPPPGKVTVDSTSKSEEKHSQIFYEEGNHTIVDILYGTDRKRNSKKTDWENYYTGERGELQYGSAQVSIPKTHQLGKMERPKDRWIWVEKEAIGKHVMITKLESIDKNMFLDFLKSKLTHVEEKDILIFIHGYNNTFADAIRRTAQIAYDLKFKGVPMAYSWPSQGNNEVLTYMEDEASVKYTRRHLVEFLSQIIDRRGDANIHIIGHSMGTRVLTSALQEISYIYRNEKVFKNIILAAPDIDRDVFKEDLMPYIVKTTDIITLYSSSDDNALEVSKTLHKGERLGQSDNIFVYPGLNTIDATGIDTSALGHSYFAEKEILMNDIKGVVEKSLPPEDRVETLVQRMKNKLKYWKILKKIPADINKVIHGDPMADTSMAGMENRMSRAAMVEWIGSQTDAEAGDIVSWAINKDLEKPDIPSFEVRLLINRHQLDSLATVMQSIIRAGFTGQLSGEDFFTSLQAATVTIAGDPNKVKQAKRMADTGLIPEFLEGLPYQSQLMAITNELWSSWSADEQNEFINALDAKLEAYNNINNTLEGWITLNKEDDEYQKVYPLSLELLP